MEDPRVKTTTPDGVDSDQEEEAREQKDSAFEITYEIDSLAASLTDGGKVIVCK